MKPRSLKYLLRFSKPRKMLERSIRRNCCLFNGAARLEVNLQDLVADLNVLRGRYERQVEGLGELDRPKDHPLEHASRAPTKVGRLA